MKYNICIRGGIGYAYVLTFYEPAEALYYTLKRLGHDVIMTAEIIQDRKNIIMGAHLCEYEDCSNHIVLQTESLDVVRGDNIQYKPWYDIIKKNLSTCNKIWAYSESNQKSIKEKFGLDSNVFRLGYVPELHRIPPNEQDIDVFMYGCVTDRRLKIYESLLNSGINVNLQPFVWGRLRDAYLSRSKVVLSVFSNGSDNIMGSQFRTTYTLNNALCTVCEDGEENPYVLLVTAPYDRLTDMVKECLKNDNYMEIRDRQYEEFSKTGMDEYLEEIL